MRAHPGRRDGRVDGARSPGIDGDAVGTLCIDINARNPRLPGDCFQVSQRKSFSAEVF